MKEKLIKISKLLMLACMGWSWIGVGFTSAFLFGEYEYPTKIQKK